MLVTNVFGNSDHVGIAWRPAGGDATTWQSMSGCWGFAIRRELTRKNKTSEAWLPTRIGFSEHEPRPAPGEEWRWPIQRYMWWDYDVEPGDTVRYKVVPVLSGASGP